MNTLHFNKPAKEWNEALPIGNGRMGAMIFGEVSRERIQLNEDSIWYGGPQERINQDALSNLPKIRKLILEGRIPEAEKLMSLALSATPCSERTYQSAGDLWIEWNHGDKGEYERLLDLEEGIVKIHSDGMDREYFASYPGQVIAMHAKACHGHKLSFTLRFERENYYDKSGRDGKDMVYLEGNTGDGGSHFRLQAAVDIGGGRKKAVGEHLIVEDAQEAAIYVAIGTDFYEKAYQNDMSADSQQGTAGTIQARIQATIQKAMRKGYEALRREHVEDYQGLYKRVEIKLSGSNDRALSFAESYFQFGRYLCIASSRPGSQPANLQGIWNDKMAPPWQSKFTININTEMNYWPVEVCNLSECHLPLFELLKRMRMRGKKVAEEMYGCRGFVAHHNTDIWADCAPQDIYIPATWWVMGAAWLCTHIRTHYSYTKDREFLKEMYPVLKDAVLFFHDFLIEDKGELVTCPSVSPENTYILPNGVKGCVCAGASMDSQILRDLFADFLMASSELGMEDEFTAHIKEIMDRLPDIKVGKYGQIMEWREDYEEEEPGHRHISQLYALHPSHQIVLDKTPKLAEAARKTLERRLGHGGGHTGWSCAWIVNLYARLGDGDSAWENLKKLWEKSTFPNLFDNHPMGEGYVFQIDGNMGAIAGMAEFLLQCDGECIRLLPALPAEWESGEVKGLVAAGGAVVDLDWKNGTLTSCRIHAGHESNMKIQWEGQEKAVHINAGEEMQFTGGGWTLIRENTDSMGG